MLICGWVVMLWVGGDIVLQGDKVKRPLSTVYLNCVWRSPYLAAESSELNSLTLKLCADESPVPAAQNLDGLVAELTSNKFLGTCP